MRIGPLLMIAVLLGLSAPPEAALAAVHPRTSLTAVEGDLMCTACHEPLASSQSPEAASERELVSHLIGLGDTKAQIERVMVAQYGPSVLARPPASGFNLSIYIIPPAAVLVGLAVVAVAVRRWRRSGRDAAPPSRAAPLPAADARRLEEDLARYER